MPSSDPLSVFAAPGASLVLVTLPLRILLVVTAFGWIVATPVDVLTVTSPLWVKPPNVAAPALYCCWPTLPPGAAVVTAPCTNAVDAAWLVLVPGGAVGTMQFGFGDPQPCAWAADGIASASRAATSSDFNFDIQTTPKMRSRRARAGVAAPA
ncbi:hypothetical protein ACVW1A_006576 [Bradyrhizobium sp. LB1.3]